MIQWSIKLLRVPFLIDGNTRNEDTRAPGLHRKLQHLRLILIFVINHDSQTWLPSSGSMKVDQSWRGLE